jgi:hypothetical protein
MNADTGLRKKTTILFPPDLYERLTAIADQRHSTVSQLVREACRAQYFVAARTDRLAVVEELASMKLPVGTPQEMELESVTEVESLS